jgi:chorismate lyase / 3-hydroxybenzoate synthase
MSNLAQMASAQSDKVQRNMKRTRMGASPSTREDPKLSSRISDFSRVKGRDPGTRSSIRSAQCKPTPNIHALRMEYVKTGTLESLLKASPFNFLGIVRHDRSSRDPNAVAVCPVVCLDLPQFSGPPLTEVWTSRLPVTYHRAEGLHCAMTDEVLFGSLQLEERPGMRLDILTYSAYRHLLLQIHALGYPHLLRVWNYFPHINRDADGLERYRHFCVGRHQALAEDGLDFPRTLPAGTAIGTMSGPLSIHFLTARDPGMHVENPRQVSAYKYPRVYGPRSPSFARATLRPSTSGSHLLIAGTASVVGHASAHIGKPHTQTLEILDNLNTLITHTEQIHGIGCEQWDEEAVFKVYVRHPEHFERVRDILKEHLPSHVQILYLQGEMCRMELLVEIEGILGLGMTHVASQTESPTHQRIFQRC